VTRLFLRSTTSRIDIRAYEVTTGAVVPSIEVGLSSSHAAGLLVASTTGAAISPDGLAAVGTTVFGSGVGGGSAVLVRTATNVATVRAVFGSGTRDTMHPIDGWAVLTAPGTSASGRLLALDASGQQVPTTVIPSPTRSGERVSGESTATFDRSPIRACSSSAIPSDPSATVRWLYPYLADRASVQLELEGLLACRPSSADGLDAGVLVAGAAEGEPMIVVVHAGSAIARVEVRFRGGAEDSMTTVPVRQCSSRLEPSTALGGSTACSRRRSTASRLEGVSWPVNLCIRRPVHTTAASAEAGAIALARKVRAFRMASNAICVIR
jgi:hypothetical protein